MFKKIAIFGLGLLGGSLCKGLKVLDPSIHVTAHGRDPSKLAPLTRGEYVDEVRDYGALSLSGIDLAVVAMPIGASIEMIRRLLEHHDLPEGAIVIDVGSVKGDIVASVRDCRRAGQFVGCHPMAGSEKSGFEFSHAALFKGASVIITPHPENRDSDIKKIREMWESLGSRIVIVSPEEHDMFVTFTSHLPHVVAGAVVGVLSGFQDTHNAVDMGSSIDIKSFIGKGFLDVTRITSSSPDMWRDIVLHNKQNILNALTLMIDELKKLFEVVSNAEPGERLHEYFVRAKKMRDMLE